MENIGFENIEDKYEAQTLKDADSDVDLIVENLRGFDLQSEFETLL